MIHTFKKAMVGMALTTVAVAMMQPAAYADVTEKHLKAAMKAIKFVKPKITSGAKVLVVHSGNAAEADAAAGLISSGKISKLSLTVDTADAAAADVSGYALVLVTPSAIGQAASLSGKIQGKGILMIGTDKACSAGGHCALTVVTEPKIEMWLSQSGASAAGVDFSKAFQMLAKKH